jgi:hypothetical protein
MELFKANYTTLFGVGAAVQEVKVPIHGCHCLIEVANKFLELEKSSIEIVRKHFE